jgi:hypothetical protein
VQNPDQCRHCRVNADGRTPYPIRHFRTRTPATPQSRTRAEPERFPYPPRASRTRSPPSKVDDRRDTPFTAWSPFNKPPRAGGADSTDRATPHGGIVPRDTLLGASPIPPRRVRDDYATVPRDRRVRPRIRGGVVHDQERA